MKSSFVLTDSEIRKLGWEALVKNMGLANATRFILQYEKGEGDYTKERQKIFKKKTVKEIISDIEKWKRSGK